MHSLKLFKSQMNSWQHFRDDKKARGVDLNEITQTYDIICRRGSTDNTETAGLDARG